MKFLDEIFAQAAAEAPREMCGLIVEENNEEKYIPVKIYPQKKINLKLTQKF